MSSDVKVKKKLIEKDTNKIFDDKGHINHLGMFIQIILLVIMVYLIIIQIFIPEFKIIMQYVTVFLLFVMAYNNHDVYKRKYLTSVYFVVGIGILVSTIFQVV